ncbi:uncharacterized protein EAE97_008017 [Botrytis byssoidea]|uniref:Uncharacterized protein n=1 Tax=Botrytis byssoidea TaxID=139641 RepID=A0A9P5LRE0_9HELO|nr:uncharacterized protein EAE97_008017 [Botrytis byssoidea]KAF7936651.1 hypothetical protein EAE97_008017 [Botrytis byssoidea]
MTNSNNISPNNHSMNQRLEMPLEIIINNASKHYNIKTGFLFNRLNINTDDLYKASSSQSAVAPGTSLESSMASLTVQSADAPDTSQERPWASSMYHFRAHTNTSQGGHQLRANAPSFHARRLLANHYLLHNRGATSRTPARGFSAHRASIKAVWDRAKAASENSGAHTSTTIFNPAIQAFTPSQGFLPRRSQAEVDSEYDCGFPYCGGFCAKYPARAANDDNNEAGQQASSSPVKDEIQENIILSQAGIEHTLEEEIDYDGDHTKEDDCLNHDAIESA